MLGEDTRPEPARRPIVKTFADFNIRPMDETSIGAFATDVREYAIVNPFSEEASILMGENKELSPTFRASLLSLGLPYQFCRYNRLHQINSESLAPWKNKFKEIYESELLDKSPTGIAPSDTLLAQIANHEETKAGFQTLVVNPDVQIAIMQTILGIKAQSNYLRQYIWFGDLGANRTTDHLVAATNEVRDEFIRHGCPPHISYGEEDLQDKKLHIKVKPEDIPIVTQRLAELWLKKTYKQDTEEQSKKEHYKSAFTFKVALGNSAYPGTPEEALDAAYTKRGLAPRIVLYGLKDGERVEDLLEEVEQAINSIHHIEPDTNYPTRFHKKDEADSTALIDIVEGSTLHLGNQRTPESII